MVSKNHILPGILEDDCKGNLDCVRFVLPVVRSVLLSSAPNLALRLETILQNLWHFALTHLKFYQVNFLNCDNHAWKFLKQLILEREVIVDLLFRLWYGGPNFAYCRSG